MSYDVAKVRTDFPILSREVYGKPLVYLDNSASAQKPSLVLDGMKQMYETEYANVHRGLHYLSNKATDAYEHSRRKVANFLNSPSEDQIVFTGGTTEAINLVAYGWAMPNLQSGDEIVLSVAEHHSNIVPWHFLRERQGVKLIFVDCDDNGVIDAQKVLDSCTPKTKLIAITHMSNVTGNITDTKTICLGAAERGIKTLIDGSQYAVHCSVDVQDLGCDWYCITGHKLYGPSGIGALYGTKESLLSMRPFQGGGEMIENVTQDSISYNAPPHRFEAGTPAIVQAVGMGLALDYMNGLGMDAINAYESALCEYARKSLVGVNSLRLIGDSASKACIFSFELEGIHAHDVSMVIDRAGIAVRAGTHCAQPLLDRFGVTSTCRASFGLYNTQEEVDSLIESLNHARTFFNV